MKASTAIVGITVIGVASYLTWSRLGDEPVDATQSAGTAAVTERPVTAAQRAAEGSDRMGNYNDDFAALNKQREGVITLPSGVQYEVLESGYGDLPAKTDSVLVRYEASLPDGRVFDTTEVDQEPLSLPLETIAVPGLREALLLMDEGAHWRVVIPPSEGFGRSGNNRLRRSDLIYDIRLVAIEATGA